MITRRSSAGIRAAALTATLISAACGPFQRGPTGDESVVIFRNESTEQAAVYIETGSGDAQRIGTVLAYRTDTLVVPRTFTSGGSNVNIRARLLAGSREPQTGAISIRPGDVYEVRLVNGSSVLTVTMAGRTADLRDP
jgi:hypothetical protein